ncbi:hypothetical protein SAMD00019534_082680 [Acytostelium subglobosum LB1]|uniref:hypothetical protein n=1 Tax=Acytostelium subglobosum LB1 TaxID=1410327 RepID=UPI000644D65E|nr:hypothetical protein SAMD00019534_082680 [Acytostelium subglobosum LB1]GAM25093.1 hypothetical protein SAMD00019534_082680 [Acytostelium subglobosum LB1]|eukprot:XP_012752182.1 hypothetical protein SAMD00019534_082680 [Acytostelium subglobosum LB1]
MSPSSDSNDAGEVAVSEPTTASELATATSTVSASALSSSGLQSKPLSIPSPLGGAGSSSNNISSIGSNSSSSGSSNGGSLNSSSGAPNPSTSPPLSDIEQYLTAYNTDLPELVVAACWWADSLGKLNGNIPKENIRRFRKELIVGLRDRTKGHWYPDAPERGQGYRAVICEETTDRLLIDAAKRSDIHGDFRTFFKQNTTMWIDPGNVTYRHGKHYEKTLYPFNSAISSNVNSNSNISAGSGTGNTLGGSAGSLLTGHSTPSSTTQHRTKSSSPSLSSLAPIFSPSSPSVYQQLFNSPPASPAAVTKDQQAPNIVYSSNAAASVAVAYSNAAVFSNRNPIKVYQPYHS